MLASTVQFSNNDQPPVTARSRRPTPGPALRKTSFPQDPTACPATTRPMNLRSTLSRAVLTATSTRP
jgi:hypothetical protein